MKIHSTITNQSNNRTAGRDRANAPSAPNRTTPTSRMILIMAVVFLQACWMNPVAAGRRDCKVSFRMDQMESMGGPFRMAPAIIDMMASDNMMEMDSVILESSSNNPGEQQIVVIPMVYQKLSTERVTMDSGATQTTWRGTMRGGLGFATLMQTSHGSMTGTFSTQDAAYSLMTDLEGNSHMKMTRWVDFTVEADVHVAATTRSNTTSTRLLRRERHTTTTTPALQAPPMTMTGTMVAKQVHDTRTNETARFLRTAHHSRELQISSVRVLLLVTNGALCEYAGLAPGCDTDSSTEPFQGRVPLLQDEMNTAMQSVGVNAEIQIVNVYYLYAGWYDGFADENTLNEIRNNPSVDTWRQENQADMVAMITRSNGPFCGIGTLGGYDSATDHTCLDGYVTSRCSWRLVGVVAYCCVALRRLTYTHIFVWFILSDSTDTRFLTNWVTISVPVTVVLIPSTFSTNTVMDIVTRTCNIAPS